MARFALVENGQVLEAVEELPTNWRNVSGLNNLANDEQALAALGWVRVVKQGVTIDPHTQILGRATYEIQRDGTVLQIDEVVDLDPETRVTNVMMTFPMMWGAVRMKRDALMASMTWRYERYARNERLGLPQAESLEEMDKYMADLANITNVATPADVVWPVYIPHPPEPQESSDQLPVPMNGQPIP